MSTPTTTQPALIVSPPSGGFDRAGVREIIKESGLSSALHKLVRAPFGHTVLTLRALDAVIAAGDLALQAGEAMHAALLEDVARTGSLAIPEPTADQRLFIGAFQVTVLCDGLAPRLAELAPTPDQVTVTVNTSQMNVTDHAEDADFAGTSRANMTLFNTYKDMIVPAAPLWVEEHVRRLSAAGIQSAFQCYNTNSFESVERLMRRGFYKGPLVMNSVAIGGGMDTPSVYSLGNFMRGVPDGAVVTVESNVRNVLPVNMMGIAMGLHVRCGTEDCLWDQRRTQRQSTVRQIEQLVRIAREFGRDIATAQQARDICRIGVFYDTVEETLAANGFAPNRNGGTQGFLRKTQ